MRQPVAKVFETLYVIWHKWPVHDLVLVIRPLPPIKVASNAQNLEEKLWMGGRREVSIMFFRPVTRSDLKQERSFFRGSVSTFLQLVVVCPVEWWEFLDYNIFYSLGRVESMCIICSLIRRVQICCCSINNKFYVGVYVDLALFPNVELDLFLKLNITL